MYRTWRCGLRRGLISVAVMTLATAEPASGWGADAHQIIGDAAEPLLCTAAASEITRLSEGESPGRIGQWADAIRAQPHWSHSAPWHYVNIPDDGDPRRPPITAQGNVIVAIENFARRLGSEALSRLERAQALRFLVHFIADIHQPLHVGRATDRGGNQLRVRYDDTQTNLHLFWDSHVVSRKGIGPVRYAARLSARVRAAYRVQRGLEVREWAAQVFSLRERVYSFDSSTGLLDDQYLQMAEDLAEEQLVLAAARLAGTLNEILCD